MIIAIQHYLDEGTETYQPTLFQNVASVCYEYQWANGENGSYWLTIRFIKGTDESKEYKNGETSVEIDPKCDTYQIYRDSR